MTTKPGARRNGPWEVSRRAALAALVAAAIAERAAAQATPDGVSEPAPSAASAAAPSGEIPVADAPVHVSPMLYCENRHANGACADPCRSCRHEARHLPLPPPGRLPYREGAPIPPGYHVENRSRRGLLIAGYVLTGVSHGLLSFAAAVTGFEDDSGWFMVPVAGPWVWLNRTDPPPEGGLVIGMLGVTQGAGAVLVLFGYVAPKPWLVRDKVALTLFPARIGSAGIGSLLSGSF